MATGRLSPGTDKESPKRETWMLLGQESCYQPLFAILFSGKHFIFKANAETSSIRHIQGNTFVVAQREVLYCEISFLRY